MTDASRRPAGSVPAAGQTSLLRQPLLRQPWAIAAASTLALTAGGLPLLSLTFGVFLKSITQETGWTRADASMAMSLMLYLTAAISPVSGLVIDRLGVRGPLVASLLLTAAAIAGLALAQSLTAFCALFALIGLINWGQQPVAYLKVVVGWFDRSRGLALGVVNSGLGIGATYMPAVAALLLTEFGWRGAYVGLAVLMLCVTLPGALFVIREKEAPAPLPATVTRETQATASLRAALATPAFWILVASAFVLAVAVNGTMPHLVSLFTDRGMSMGEAVGLMTIAGAFGVVGRIGAGFIADRVFAPYIALGVFLLAACAMAVLWLNSPLLPPALAVMALGLSLGAEVDLMGYMASRYFPKALFARIYGFIFGALICGSGVGVYAMGRTYDALKTYGPCIAVFLGLVFLTGFLSLRLGPYVYPPARHAPAGGTQPEVAPAA